ncbi:synaptic vesicular amine transporter-like isoform X2 [Macrosteles quadrilineatus]|uniref:synaptic vesicular amine transporter-like isoform X2 n=1 Tax=Macrosteles quadrilineatus TaxID=74068 RepID=UPI0023E3390B|nr:synaptic vesicular amine transporter-like isoform X2 [Macrosteles quadrilineatus]
MDSVKPFPIAAPRIVIVAIVYLSLFLDNILLTVVVPIIPDYLYTMDENTRRLSLKTYEQMSQFTNKSVLEQVVDENVPVSLLLSSKALVQLVMNPVVGALTSHCGYQLPLFIGSLHLLLAALLFAFSESYLGLFIARSLQGIASACIGVSGMCLIAEYFPTETSRSRVMGFILGSVALGVLLGYPFGGFLYDFFGKTIPFLFIAFFVLTDLVLQLSFLDLKPTYEGAVVQDGWLSLLTDGYIVLCTAAIWLSSSAMAILEPCLPLWLMANIKPQKWQLGTVFIPDSIGYLLGTNCFGLIALRLGRWRVAVAAMLLVGVSAFMVPSAKTMAQLTLPHLGLGLGIGVVDSALVPLLATLVDARHCAHYGVVYALQQMAVSLAYCLGPMIGGEVVHLIGFPWLLRAVGIINIVYCPLLILLSRQASSTSQTAAITESYQVNYKTNEESKVSRNKYERFFNPDDESD